MYTLLRTAHPTSFFISSCPVFMCLYSCIFALLGEGCFNLIVHVYSDNKDILILLYSLEQTQLTKYYTITTVLYSLLQTQLTICYTIYYCIFTVTKSTNYIIYYILLYYIHRNLLN